VIRFPQSFFILKPRRLYGEMGIEGHLGSTK
jgi:hypothetical protein